MTAIIAALLVLGALLVPTGAAAASPTPTATPTSTPTSTPVLTSTPTATSTSTPRPTSTATATPVASSTPTLTPLSIAPVLATLTALASAPTPVILPAVTDTPTITPTVSATPAQAGGLPAGPYIQLVPPIGTSGGQVTVYGSGFCGAAGCSPVTVKIGNRAVDAGRPGTDGRFQASFVVGERPGIYRVTADQTSADGSRLMDWQPFNVPHLPGASATTPGRAAAASVPRSSVLAAGVSEFQPTITDKGSTFGGRTVAVDVDPFNPRTAIAASESGGLFRTTDSGVTWTHIATLPPFRMSDVKYDPIDNQVVIASAKADTSTNDQGGIWRSADGGLTWSKPATADPSCTSRFSSWGISFPPGPDVFVGTDCGVAASHDKGLTWTHITIAGTRGIFSVVAQPGTLGAGTVDACGDDGHHQSTDFGLTWPASAATPTPPGVSLPGCFDVHTIDVSPLERNVLFANVGAIALPSPPSPPPPAPPTLQTQLFESDDGGVTWTNLNLPTGSGSGRTFWVRVHRSPENPTTIDVYAGNQLNVYRQTCGNAGGPGLRCSASAASWQLLTTDHADIQYIAFAPFGGGDVGNGCPQYLVTDGGVHVDVTDLTKAKCGSTWHLTGGGTGGYDALQLYEITGQVHPGGHTDLYFGTQDNKMWASENGGTSWENPECCEGFYIQTLHSAPSDTGQIVTFAACGPPCPDFRAGAHFSAPTTPWTDAPNAAAPPGAAFNNGYPFQIDTGVYVQFGIAAATPPVSQLYLTTNGTAATPTWTPVSGATINLGRAGGGRVTVSGPAANPTLYVAVNRPAGVVGLQKITGVRNTLPATATVSNADTGLGNIGANCLGDGSFFCLEPVYGVDPNDPRFLIVPDLGTGTVSAGMKFSKDGGASWTTDTQLTNLVTASGKFLFNAGQGNILQGPGFVPFAVPQAHFITFDPSNGNRVLVGTEAAGIIFTTNFQTAVLSSGTPTWSVIPGSNLITASSFGFFDEVNNQIFVSSYGRGLWKVSTS